MNHYHKHTLQIVSGLLAQGLSKTQISKVMGGNMVQVLRRISVI